MEDLKALSPDELIARIEGDEYAAFRAISKKPDLDDINLVMEMAEKEKDPEVKGLLRKFLEMLSKLDSESIEEAKRRNPDMAKTWRDIFGVDQEINNAVSSARADERRTNLYTYVQDGAMAIDYAARQANMTTDQFRQQMEEYNRSQNLQTV